MACHFRGCQKLTSGPYSIPLIVPSSGFGLTRGEPVIGGLHGEHEHFYCDDCKSWLFTRPNSPVPIVNVRATMLEDCSWVVPFVDIFLAAKLPGVQSGAKQGFDGFPLPDAYGRLIEGFAEEGCHP